MPRKKAPAQPAAKKTERRDPPSRSLRGRDALFAVVNKDPGCEYRWVARTETALAHYESIGYEPVRYSEDGPQLVGRSALAKQASDTDVMERMGHVLMSIPKADADHIRQFGEYGDAGQDRADKLEERILDRKGKDLMRGIGSDFQFENTTTAAERLGG